MRLQRVVVLEGVCCFVNFLVLTIQVEVMRERVKDHCISCVGYGHLGDGMLYPSPPHPEHSNPRKSAPQHHQQRTKRRSLRLDWAIHLWIHRYHPFLSFLETFLESLISHQRKSKAASVPSTAWAWWRPMTSYAHIIELLTPSLLLPTSTKNNYYQHFDFLRWFAVVSRNISNSR